MQKFYTVKEVAGMLRTTPHSLLKLIHSGEFEASNTSQAIESPRWIISERMIDDFVKKRSTKFSEGVVDENVEAIPE